MDEHKHGPVTGSYMGFPYRGDVMLLKKTDSEKNRPQRYSDTLVKVLDLSMPDDLKEYQDICDRITKQQGLLSFEERKFVPETRSWVVLIRWIEVWYAMPEGKD